MSSSSSSAHSQKSRTRQRITEFCSTPLSSCFPGKINLTMSTLTGDSASQNPKAQIEPQEKLPKKIHMQKKKKKKRKKIKKKEVAEDIKRETDIDWETKSERTTMGHVTVRNSELDKVVSNSIDKILFYDLGSPERVRKAVHDFEENILESPVLQSRTDKYFSPREKSLGQDHEILKDVPLISQRDLESSGDEEEDKFQKGICDKRYPATAKKVQIVEIARKSSDWIDSSRWLVDTKPLTATANLLWEEFVKNNPEKFSRRIAPPKKHFFQNRNIQPTENNETKKVPSTAVKRVQGRKPKNAPKSPEVFHGKWDRVAKKWIRTCDLYTFPQDSGAELEKEVQTGREITFREFCRRRNEEKKKRNEDIEVTSLSTIDNEISEHENDVINRRLNCDEYRRKYNEMETKRNEVVEEIPATTTKVRSQMQDTNILSDTSDDMTGRRKKKKIKRRFASNLEQDRIDSDDSGVLNVAELCGQRNKKKKKHEDVEVIASTHNETAEYEKDVINRRLNCDEYRRKYNEMETKQDEVVEEIPATTTKVRSQMQDIYVLSDTLYDVTERRKKKKINRRFTSNLEQDRMDSDDSGVLNVAELCRQRNKKKKKHEGVEENPETSSNSASKVKSKLQDINILLHTAGKETKMREMKKIKRHFASNVRQDRMGSSDSEASLDTIENRKIGINVIRPKRLNNDELDRTGSKRRRIHLESRCAIISDISLSSVRYKKMYANRWKITKI